MNNIFTLVFSINDFEKHPDEQYELSSLTPKKNPELATVWEALDRTEFEAPKLAVDKMMKSADTFAA